MLENISVSYLSFRLSNLCSIAYLVGMLGYNGRVSISWVLPSLILFNFLYYLNFYLNTLLSYSTAVKSFSFQYLDDYGTTLVYLFGGIYGMIVSFFTKQKREVGEERKSVSVTTILSLSGSLFLFATFIFTSTSIIDGGESIYSHVSRLNTGPTIILFALVGSIIGNTIINMILNKGFLLIQSFIIGSLPGGIIVGVLASELENVGAATIVGVFSGFITGFYMNKIHPKVNGKNIIDTHGLLGPIIISAFLGSFVIPPCILNRYFNLGFLLRHLTNRAETDFANARYQLAYFAVTFGIALVTGLILGILAKLSKNNQATNYRDEKFFVQDYGLYDESREAAARGNAPGETQQYIQRGDVI